MKKLNLLLFTALAAVLSMTSCKKDDVGSDSFGITGLTVATADGTVRQGVINQNALTITVNMPVSTQASELEECTITATVTMNTTVTIGEDELTGNTFDLTSPVVLSAKNSGVIREYTLTVTCTEEEADLATGKLISADITAGGLPANTYAYSVGFYDGKFYAFTAGATGDEGAYKVYTSTNGKLWSEMTTTDVIGGMGTTPIVYNGKLYAVGGIRVIGNDQQGNEPEIEDNGWSKSLTLKTLRMFSTTGSSWTDESLEGEQDPDNMFKTMLSLGMFGFTGPFLYEYNNTLYMQNGNMMSYGMFQGSNSNLYKFNGTTFEPVQSAQSALKASCTTFVLNNKVFIIGGSRGFIGPETLIGIVSSSDDGENFTDVAETTAIGNFCGATVVTNKAGNVAYLFGGLYYNEDGGREMNSTIYRTTDGVEWTAVENINPAYAGTFRPSIVVDDNDIAYVFGGFSSVIGNYTPFSLTQDDMDPSFAAWAFQIQ
ncbi:MAG: hypothetical protein J1E02_05320 [Coprobacter sp.]|nr:hypothetical protein [Coprobacter sp.]